jgi:NADP-dependent 3-hydroxy acid dehydrogenase YdfG
MKTILITGASSGIGLATARKVSSGNRLILCSRSAEDLKKIKKELKLVAADVQTYKRLIP